jgi:hypothetical protein
VKPQFGARVRPGRALGAGVEERAERCVAVTRHGAAQLGVAVILGGQPGRAASRVKAACRRRGAAQQPDAGGEQGERREACERDAAPVARRRGPLRGRAVDGDCETLDRSGFRRPVSRLYQSRLIAGTSLELPRLERCVGSGGSSMFSSCNMYVLRLHLGV